MKQELEYIRQLFIKEDDVLASIPQGLETLGMPQISIPKEVGRLLHLLVKISGAKHALEVGTLGGYSSLWIARALPVKGSLTSIDLNSDHAEFAEENIRQAGLQELVNIQVGDAKKIMDQLIHDGKKYDFFFIDADKGNYPLYLEKAITLANSGALILLDNLLFHGRVIDEHDRADSPQKLRQTNSMLASDPRLESLLLPIGDGVGLARVK